MYRPGRCSTTGWARASSASSDLVRGTDKLTRLAAALVEPSGPGCRPSNRNSRAASVLNRAAGYRYETPVLQAEFSLTQMLDRPITGRIFFEQVIRDNLDMGRPDQVGLIFGRRIFAAARCAPRARSAPASSTPG